MADPQKRGDGAKSRYSKYSKMYTDPGSELLRIPPDIIICQDLETLQVVKCLV